MDKTQYEQIGSRRYSAAEVIQSHDLDTMYSQEATEIRFEMKQNEGRENMKNTAKVLLPYRRKPKEDKGPISPMDASGIFPSLFYTWLTPLFSKSFRKHPLQEEDLEWMMSQREAAEVSSERDKGPISPMDASGIFPSLFYTWLTPLFSKSFRKHPLQEEDLEWMMSQREAAEVSSESLELMHGLWLIVIQMVSTDVQLEQPEGLDKLTRLWQEELVKKGEEDASLGKTLIRFIRTRLIFAMILSLVSLGSSFLLGTYILYLLVNFLADQPVVDIQQGLLLALYLFLSTAFRAIGTSFSWYISVRTSCRLRAALLMTIYKKLLSVQSLSETSVGEIVNIYVNDGQRLLEACVVSAVFSAAPIFMVILLIATIVLIGPASIVGVVVMLLIFFSQVFLARIIGQIRSKIVGISDRRVRLLGELLANIGLIKKYAWEETFCKTILGVRNVEQSFLQRANYMQSFSIAMAIFISPAAAMATIVTQVLAGGTVTAAQAYALLSLFYGLAVVIFIIPMALKPLAETSIALRRMKVVLLMKESTSEYATPEDEGDALEIIGGSYSWGERPEEAEVNEITASQENLDKIDDDGVNWKEGEKLVEPNGGEKKRTYMLKNIDLKVPKGQLVGICGAVGSGKSSLLYAILDQMETISGSVALDGSLALMTQQAWIQNETVRENILFSKSYDKDKYDSVVEACSLTTDFEIMANKDSTEIGERGINLSGGQKQRISIARALYADRDIYLLDDPLSAVDTHVGSHVFNKCIKGALKGKTILFVTHQLQYLEKCDSIILMKNGLVEEQGTHQELMASEGEYAKLIQTFIQKETKKLVAQRPTMRRLLSVKSPTESISGKFEEEDKGEEIDGGRLIAEEGTGGSVVQLSTYAQYIRYMGGPLMAFLLILVSALTVFFLVVTNACVAIWLRAADLAMGMSNNGTMGGEDAVLGLGDQLGTFVIFYVSAFLVTLLFLLIMCYVFVRAMGMSNNGTMGGEDAVLGLGDQLGTFVIFYVSAFLVTLLFLLIMCYVFVRLSLRASTKLHNTLFQRVIRCPMSFFDTTPLGRILNRFSKDLDEVDVLLPTCLQKFGLLFFAFIISLIVVGVLMPWYFIILGVVFPLIFMYTIFFRRGFCELKFMEGVSLSKVIAHLSATMQGLVTIKTFRKTDYFIRSFGRVLDKNTIVVELFHTTYRWVHIRLDLISAFSTGATAVLVVLLHEQVSPAFAGWILFTGINMCSGVVQSMVTVAMEAESCFVAVERMIEYLKILEPEAPEVIEDNRPAADWPNEGKVQFLDVLMRYRDNLPWVLKGVTLNIAPKERIGIVGRTGSGKSTLGVALFRIVELSGGKIVIDGIDISTIGLKDLRSKLSIIPQDPVLFIGTLRYNLDPMHQYSDEELWSALDQSHIKDKITQLEGKLEAPVIENGDNFSVGERQLICMARAILRNSKVLILDEATAAIDTETDSLIQKTIRNAFKGCTMLIIAHRLNTVHDCDRMLVMHDGKVGEFDKPDTLLSNSKSMLSKMVAAGKH